MTANKNGDNIVRETFVTLGKSGGDEKADAEAIGRLISLYLQHGGSIQEVIHTLKGIQGRDISWDNGQQLLSVPDAVAKALASSEWYGARSRTRAETLPRLRRNEHHLSKMVASDALLAVIASVVI